MACEAKSDTRPCGPNDGVVGRPTSGTNGVHVELKAFSGKVLSPFSPHLEPGITIMTHVLPFATASLRSFTARSSKKK